MNPLFETVNFWFHRCSFLLKLTATFKTHGKSTIERIKKLLTLHNCIESMIKIRVIWSPHIFSY